MDPETQHPDPLTLKAFALGRLSTRQMSGLESHLAGCATCARVVMAVPDDHLIKALRRAPGEAQPAESAR
jgi:hypothetical protein